MDTVLTIVQWLLPLLYMAIVIDYGAAFFLRVRMDKRPYWVSAAVMLHMVFVWMWSLEVGHPPLFSAYEVLTLIAVLTAIVYCVMEDISGDRRTGVFVFMLVLLMQYTSSVFLEGQKLVGSDRAAADHAWRTVHSVAATASYTALALAAIHGALHLIGRRNLKRHNVGLLFDRLPPLELLGNICWFGLIAAWVFVTVSVVTGGLVFGTGGSGGLPPKVIAKMVMGFTTWGVCAIAVLGKLIFKLADTRVSAVAVIGCAVMAALFVISLGLS